MPLRNHLFAAFALASLFASASACKDSALPEPRAQETTDPEKDEDGDDPVFENFDACTMSEGPSFSPTISRRTVKTVKSYILQIQEWKTVATSHICSEEYRTPGFGPWVYCSGFQNGRGIWRAA